MSGIHIQPHDPRFATITAHNIMLDRLSYCLHRGPYESVYELALILYRSEHKAHVCSLDVILTPRRRTDSWSSIQRITIGPFPVSMTLAALVEQGLQSAPRLVILNTVLPRYTAQIYRSLNQTVEDQRQLLARIDADIDRELKKQARPCDGVLAGTPAYQEA